MTYSIVARNPQTGEMGVAVQSHWFSVGSIVGWAEAGVGAIATQALVNPAFGPDGLQLLRKGKTPTEALHALLDADEGYELRQVAILGTNGEVAAHTGARCIVEAGHQTGAGFSVQANMMLNKTVWPAMAEAYTQSTGPLAERMVAALEAAQAEGGDVRGQQSAALLVVRAQATGKPWEDRVIDLRVEDHPAPVDELKRLLRVHRAYQHMNAGDEALEAEDIDRALQEYGSAEALLPGNLEPHYWHAISLANLGRLGEALPMFRSIFAQDINWRTLTERLPAAGLLDINEQDLQAILSVI